MSKLRYPISALWADLMRSGFGVAVTGAPLIWLELSSVAIAIFSALVCLFGVFGVLTLQRGRTTIELCDDKITILPAARTVIWSDLSQMHLRYYTTRSERDGGWMQLALKSGKVGLKMDSRLTGFDAVVTRALKAAQDNGIELTAATAANLGIWGARMNKGAAHAPTDAVRGDHVD